MKDKSQKTILNSSSKQFLIQTEEVDRLKQQIIELQNNLKIQYHHFLNQTANHQLCIEKIITKLTLTRYQIQPIRQDSQKSSILNSLIDFCLQQLELLIESHQRLRNFWSLMVNQTQEESSPKMCQKCLDCACKEQIKSYQNYERQGFSKQKFEKLPSNGSLEQEVGQLELRYEEILKQNKKIKQQFFALSALNTQNANKLKEYSQQINNLNEKNKQLSMQLKQYKEMTVMQSDLWTSKFQSIERENKRLFDLQKQAFTNQFEMNKIIEENERQIEKIHEEVHHLKLVVHSFQIKFREIIENQVRTKNLEDLKYRKLDQKNVLCEIPTQNTIDSVQSKLSKKELQKIRKLNLQQFQQKLSNFNLIA